MSFSTWGQLFRATGSLVKRRRRGCGHEEGFQDGGETCRVVWFGDAGTDQKTGGRAGRGGVKDPEILSVSDEKV